MPKFLVVYYSRTGHTEQVAKALAERLGADLEPIREKRSRLGFMEYWRSGRESLFGILPTIEPSQHDPAGYDLVILGSPVWASQPSTPMRAYLAANKRQVESRRLFRDAGRLRRAKDARQDGGCRRLASDRHLLGDGTRVEVRQMDGRHGAFRRRDHGQGVRSGSFHLSTVPPVQ